MWAKSMRRFLVVVLASGLMLAGCLGNDNTEDGISFNGLEYNPPVDAVDFTLTDQNGNNVSFSDFEGKVVVVAFTYTHCPDVCPVIEANMKYMAGEMGDTYGEDVVYISISIDPLRDTPEVLANYVEENGYEWPHLTSTDYDMIKGVWNSWGVAVNSSMIDAHVSEEMEMEDDNQTMDIDHTFTVINPDNSSSTTELTASELPSMNGWRLTETGMAASGIDFNASNDPTYGHFINNISGIDAPEDWSWWWGLYLWNDSSNAWEESSIGIDTVDLNTDAHVAWVPSNGNHSLLPVPSDGNHTFAVLFPDNTTTSTDITQSELALTAWDLTVAGMQKSGVDYNATNDPTYGHFINNISGIDAPEDWSWWWNMFVWNGSSGEWESSQLGLDSTLLMNEPHIAWAPSNIDPSIMLDPVAEECDRNGWVMGSGNSAHCMCDIGYQWDGDDHLSCVSGEGQGAHDGHEGDAPEEYDVGHSTVTFIIDREGQKRVAWTGSDWSADNFLADILALV